MCNICSIDSGKFTLSWPVPKTHAKSHRHVNFITHNCTVLLLFIFSVFNNRITLYFLGRKCPFCAKFIGLDLDVYLDFRQFERTGKFDIHVNEEYGESKSIFLPPFTNFTYTSTYVRTAISFLQRNGKTRDLFIHQVDNHGNEYCCWRVDIEIDADDENKHTGYFVYDGEKYYQTAISIWICQNGILSLYPGGTGWTLDGTKNREFREDLQSKFNTYSFTPSMRIQSNNKNAFQ